MSDYQLPKKCLLHGVRRNVLLEVHYTSPTCNAEPLGRIETICPVYSYKQQVGPCALESLQNSWAELAFYYF